MSTWKNISVALIIVVLGVWVISLSGCNCPCADEDYTQHQENVLQYTGDLPEQNP